jgi:hypothetical protein
MMIFHRITVIGGALVVLGILTVGKSVLTRAGDRAAVWLLPDHQPASFRVAWCIVRLSSWIAPANVFRFRGLRRDMLGFDYAVFPTEWWAPAEARADLEFAHREHLPAVQPVRLVLPLLREGLALRYTNTRERTSALMLTLCYVFVLLVVMMPASVVLGFARLAKDVVRRHGLLLSGTLSELCLGLVSCPYLSYVVLREALTGKRFMER